MLSDKEGVTLIEIFTRKIPYPGENPLTIAFKLANKEMTPTVPQNVLFSYFDDWNRYMRSTQS